MSDSGVTITDNAGAARYEVYLDGARAGLATYRAHGDQVVFTHTEIDPEFGGHGLGSALIKWALEDVRAHGKLVVPLCPFVAAYIRDHREYVDLVAPSHLADVAESPA